jgi:hypothetical protein
MRSSSARALALVAALAGFPAAASGVDGGKCSGTVSGDVTATFSCTALLGTQEGGQLAFSISIPGPIEGIPALVPGAFLVPGKATARTYTLDELGFGKASVAAEGGALYTAAKTSSQRGEVTLTIRSLKKSVKIPGAWDVHGTYRARLLRVGGGQKGEVVVDVKF